MVVRTTSTTEPPRPETEVAANMRPDHALSFEFIEKRQWDKLIDRIQTHPREASTTEGMASALGNLTLHEACKNQPPLKVIEVLLEAYPDAIKIKGRWGYTALHYACSSGASPDVVARLIKAYPTATRVRDESNEYLPIHLAAKWGASEEVMMSILATHPEGCFLKDAVGKTPKDHAKLLPLPIRNSVIRALNHGPLLCAVSKAALDQMEHENECRIKGMSEAHSAHIAKLQHRHEEELMLFIETEDSLRNDIMATRSEVEAVTEKHRLSEKRAHDFVREQEFVIGKLDLQLKKLQIQLEAQGQELNALLENAEEKVELLEGKLAEKSSQADEFAILVTDLTNKLEIQRKDEESLAKKIVLLEKAKADSESDLKEALSERDQLRTMISEGNDRLEEANRKNHSYAERIDKLQMWASMFAYGTQTWSIDAEWDSDNDKMLESIAKDIQTDDHDGDKSLQATETDESSVEYSHCHDDVDESQVPTHVV